MNIISKWGNGTLKSPLHGFFNLSNSLSAMATALCNGISFDDVLRSLSLVKPAPGRFQVVQKDFLKQVENYDLEKVEKLPICIIDYAHTPDGLKNVLETAKNMIQEKRKLICVFGCGGDRDSTKRPIMGKIANNLADFSIITTDNPRTEDPNQIVSDILSGISTLNAVEIELDRGKAIRRALSMSNPMDIVLIAGKGHETYQLIGDQEIYFNDYEEVQKIFTEMLN